MTQTRISIPTSAADSNDAGALLILLNPGRMSRHWLLGMIEGARQAGIRTEAVELGQVWDVIKSGRQSDAAGFARSLCEKRVRAVIGYTSNGMNEWPARLEITGAIRPFFEQLGIPHLMWWSDHPQWASDRAALAPNLQTALRSPNHHHFVKSQLAADELHSIAGWPNCYGMPVAESAEQLRPIDHPHPDCDVVAILGSPPMLDASLERFLNEDDPDVEAIHQTITVGVKEKLKSLWGERAPEQLRTELTTMGDAWATHRSREPLTGSFRIFERLGPEFPRASVWLRAHYRIYFDALDALWNFGRWQRTFVIRYLARFVKVCAYGYDWSGVGIPGGGWVSYEDQPAVYARGRVALNVLQCNDEEGIAHKPFQIAACGVPMVHQNRYGIEDCFTPQIEFLPFQTPRESLEAVRFLLDDSQRRVSMAEAARARLSRDHTWRVRVPQLLDRAGIDVAKAFEIDIPSRAPRPANPPTSAVSKDRPLVHA